MARSFGRRQFLKGMMAGSAVTVGLPFLEVFLNAQGTALASGAPIPTRFGTWFWGLGMNERIFVPRQTGANYDLPEEIAALAPVRDQVNIFTNFNATTDGRPNLCHYTGWVVLRCGAVPLDRTDLPGQSVDVTIADAIGRGTPFRCLDVNATGDARDTYSFRGRNGYNVPETSPASLYRQIFGPRFQDPNSDVFVADPRIIAEKSVLSGIIDESAKLNATLGYEDRIRLDQYFTGLRDMENQLAHFLEKPEPLPACVKPPEIVEEYPKGVDYSLVAKRHELMTDLLVMAVACNQTRVFNMTYANSFANTVKPGYDKGHHTITHEEIEDPVLGYQVMSSWFNRRAMESWASFVKKFADFPEGDGSLLDNMVIYAHSDQNYAKIHSISGIPMFTAGKAGGRLKTGIHIDGGQTPGTRLPFTLQRVMGIELDAWGVGANRATSDIGEILV
ncbi:MAG: DUF1552 domain-containing protein [Pseudomonadota bacterium]|nr:DUF1552 domain-containing protein [Pseudomonadota bacterium]